MSQCAGCGHGKRAYARGLCHPCYRSAQLAGTLPPKLTSLRTRQTHCVECGRETRIEGKGLCRRCWYAARKSGGYVSPRRKVQWQGGTQSIAYGIPKVGRCAMGLHWSVIGEGIVDEEPCYRVVWSYGDDWTPKEGLEILHPYQQAQKEVDAPLRCLQTARMGKCETREDDEWPM